MIRKEVQAQFLKAGQTLATGEKVTRSAIRGYGTPRGKVELHINGYFKFLNARTVITVLEKPQTNKDMTYLHLYNSLHREKRMPFAGLCACVNFSMGYHEQKSFSDIMGPRSLAGLKHHFWGSDDPVYPLHGKFTPLRQNLLLLMAAYNNEL